MHTVHSVWCGEMSHLAVGVAVVLFWLGVKSLMHLANVTQFSL